MKTFEPVNLYFYGFCVRVAASKMIPRTAIRRFPGVFSTTSPGRVRVLPTIDHRTLATAATPPSSNDPFANGTNAYYAEEMYRHWKQDPKSVHASWQTYFSGMEHDLPSAKAFQPPSDLTAPPADGTPALYADGGAELDDHLKVPLLPSVPLRRSPCVGSTTTCAHLSNSWPSRCRAGSLGILDADLADVHPPELELSHYGFTERDLDKQIGLGPGILPHFATEDRTTMSFRGRLSHFSNGYTVCRFHRLSKNYPHCFCRWCCRDPVRSHSGQGAV